MMCYNLNAQFQSQSTSNYLIIQSQHTCEALWSLTGLTPITITAEEAAKLYIMRKSQVHEIDCEVQPKDWLQSVDSVRFI